jgi:drug/metabolite transporter (DMT)-like permease
VRAEAVVNESSDRRGEVLAFVAAVLWGTSWPAIAIALSGLSPLGIALFRGGVQGIVLLLLLAAVTGRRVEGFNLLRWRPTARQTTMLIGLGLLGGFFNVGQSYAVELSGSASASFVAGLYPVVAVVAAPFVLTEPITRRSMLAVGLAGLGVLLIASPGSADGAHLAGVGMGALAAVSFGLFLVLGRRLMASATLPPLVTTVAAFFGTAVVASAISAVVAGPLVRSPGPELALAMAWLVVVAGVLPLALTEIAIRAVPTARSSPYLFITPLVAVFIAVLGLGERPSAIQLLGGALVIVGIAVATSAPTRAVTADRATA